MQRLANSFNGIKIVPLLTILALLNSCISESVRESYPTEVCYEFAKAVASQDTSLFYFSIDTDSVSKHWIANYSFEIKIKKNEIHKIVFFKYSPWILKDEDLKRIKKEDYTLDLLEISVIDRNANLMTMLLKWQSIKGTGVTTLKVFLYQNNERVWKIKGIVL